MLAFYSGISKKKVGACPTQQSLGLGIGLRTLPLPSNCFRSYLNAKRTNVTQ
jgi:hypothetical protein